jgi:hypothetical protein
MAAGLGFKDFVTGEVLTAADVDGYLMQGILVFASAAARDSAITSPQEGQFAYLKDTNVTTYYTGSAWANVDTTGMTNPMTTTGDTIYSSSGSTPARLGIGTAGQVLQVNSGATAPEWATPAGGGGMTLLETLTLTGATVTSSSISGSYVDLVIYVENFKPASDGQNMQMRINSDSNARYNSTNMNTNSSNAGFSETEFNIALGQDSTTATGLSVVNLYRYASAGIWKCGDSRMLGNNDNTVTNYDFTLYKYAYNQTGAITSLFFKCSSGNFTSGTVYIYGVK